MSIENKIKSILYPDTWCCAVRFNNASSTSILNNLDEEFFVIKDGYRYWTADPFLVFENNKYYLFFEVFDRLKRKGLLGYREISKSSVGDIRIIYESYEHLSYPFIYKKGGEYFIVPESNKQGELFRLKCIDFPDKWEKEKVLANDNLVDTTITVKDGVTYYISERVVENNVFDRIDLLYEKDGVFIECENNPVKLDANTSRGAGKLFEYNGKLIRPSQDCGKAYGEKLNFNEIKELSENSFREETVKSISHNDLKLNCKNDFIGIHTYNTVNNVEVVDLKIKGKFNVLNTLGAIIKQIKRIFKG